jgi:creatinine amidohydrolase
VKPHTVFMGEMTNGEIEAYLEHHTMVIVPVGSTEQHGPHGPLLTDAIIPTNVAGRIADRVNALVAPTINYSLSYPHAGFKGVVYLRMRTFADLIEDIALGLATAGFRRIVFLNGHYDNTLAIAYACADAQARLPKGTQAYPVNYWDGMTAEESSEFFGPETGLHANKGEMSAILAINPAWFDHDAANAEMPPLPTVTNQPALHTAFFSSNPGSVYDASKSGTWGDARDATAEYGERFLGVVSEATVRLLDDIERTYAAMPDR